MTARWFCVLAVLWGASALAGAGPRVAARIVKGPVPLDHPPVGGLWDRAGRIETLTQQSPKPGAPTPFTTRVMLMHTRRAIYIGIVAVDPDPSRIAIHSLSRDVSQAHDDHVTIVIDPMHRGRRAFVFQVNAGGARRDGLISPASSSPSWNWNGIWNARTWRSKRGWEAVIRIPVTTLRFDPENGKWGLNIARYVSRKQLTLTWAGHTLDSSVYNLQREGTLAGMTGLVNGRGLRVAPYALVSARSAGQRVHRKAGLTVTDALTSSMTGALTVRPDFAEAEAESQEINLTPYPLFLPEKRRFFLEGSNLFTFAAGLGNHFIPFYSRRIGLVNGHIIPIDAGAKVVGEQGPASLGILDVRTAASSGIQSQNLFAGRATWDVGEGLTLGTIMTHGNPSGATPNSLYGADATWQTSSFRRDKNLDASAWAVRSNGSELPGNSDGWGIRLAYPNDLWDWGFDYNVYGNALDPAMGFLPRPGTRMSHAWIKYQPRPASNGTFGWARQFFFQAYFHYNTGFDGNLEDWHVYTVPFAVTTNSGAYYEVDVIPKFQRLYQPFNVAGNVWIPKGNYRYNLYRIQADSPASYQWQVGGSLESGTFYNGNLKKGTGYIRYSTRGGHLKLSLQAEQDFGYLPVGNFVDRLYALGVTWAKDPNVTVSSLAQYDTVSHHVSLNSIFRWIIEPGSDLFIILDHGVSVLTNTNPGGYASNVTRLAVKLLWTFDG